MKSTLLNRIALCILLALAPISESLAAAGKFNFVIGDVRVTSTSGERKAEKGKEVEAGETIVSGKDGIAQLRMSDGAFIAVRADTALRIDQYQFSGKADASSTSVLSLVKGTFRAFTGAIAAFNKDKFVMKTPGATIGIRGSGNVLNFTPGNGITLNHTIEGSHTITAVDPSGAMRTLVTLPGQTVQVNATGVMQFVPTPAFILNAATGAPEPKMKQQKEQSQQQNADKQNADNKGDDKKGADKQGGNKQSGDKQSADKQGADKQSADKQGADKQSADKQGSALGSAGAAGKPDPAAGGNGAAGGTPPDKGAGQVMSGGAAGMAPGAAGMPGMPAGGMGMPPPMPGMMPPPPPGMMPPPPPGMMPPPPPPPYVPPPYKPPATNPPP